MLEFYGLREQPFGVSPDPRFFYPSPQHQEALSSLTFGIESKVGFAALIAPPGTGKTTILFDILTRYRERASTAFVFNTQCTGQELLRYIVLELQIPNADFEQDPIRLHQMFTTFVADRLRVKPVVIIIDEAQNLENTAMESLRLLSNFEAADRKLLHIILAGQPQLGEKLRSPNLTQLLQRITTISRLGHFTPEETEECIAYRLRVAGHSGAPLFTSEALGKITRASAGIPREINRICINALQIGFGLRQRTIGVEVIEKVLADLNLAEEPLADRTSRDDSPERKREPDFHPAESTSRKQDTETAAQTPRVVSRPPVQRTEVQRTATLRAVRTPQPVAAPQIARPRPVAQQQAEDKSLKLKKLRSDWAVPVLSSIALGVLVFVFGGALRQLQPMSAKIPIPAATATETQAAPSTQLPATLADTEMAAATPDITSSSQTPPAKAPSFGIDHPKVASQQRIATKSESPGSMARKNAPPFSSTGSSVEEDRKPVLMKFVRPVYPPAAKDAHVEGKVSLKVDVGGDGSVQQVRVLSGDPLLAQAAKDAVQKWHYYPALLDGSPVAAEEKVTVSFREHE